MKRGEVINSNSIKSIQILFALCCIISRISLLPTIDAAYIKSRCGFQSPNYTIKWAFEPQTRNVVFVLKAKLPSEQPALGGKGGQENLDGTSQKQLITGIAFGSEVRNCSSIMLVFCHQKSQTN